MPDIEKEKIRFKRIIWKYYKKNKRKLPWRETKDPYKILVSEVMLQQTQVSRVMEKYPSFLKVFPNFKTLAEAKSSDILKEWSGLGYNRRAFFLQRTAKIIHEDFSDDFPLDPLLLEKLPGLGKATSRSILVFSKNIPFVFIETNIRRVFIYFFFSNEKKIHDREVEKLVEKTLDRKKPRDWYFALMDYGAFLGRLKENPNKKSMHYNKQSKFEGSVRKIRGEILRILIEQNEVSKRILEEKYKKNLEKFSKAFEGLVKEKIVELKKGVVSIKID